MINVYSIKLLSEKDYETVFEALSKILFARSLIRHDITKKLIEKKECTVSAYSLESDCDFLEVAEVER